MSLRSKLMMVLLLTAVLPMLAVRAVQAVSIYKLQASVAQDMRQNLTDQAEEDMLRTVDDYAQKLDQQGKLAFTLLRVQASEVERRLDAPVPANPLHIPTVREFARLQEEDPHALEVIYSDVHAVVNDKGEFEPLAISYGTQVVLPTRNRQVSTKAREDITKLGDMTPVYRQIHDQADQFILWQYTSLDSGLHFSYPGKSGFPPGYAPQQRGWYRQAIQAGQAVGTRPFVDASTRQLVITFAQPLRARDGQAAGVTAIDLRVSRLLDPEALNTEWASEARVMVVAAYPARQEEPAPNRAQRRDERQRTPQPGDENFGEPRENRPTPAPGEAGGTASIEPQADTSFPADVYIVAYVDQKREGRLRLSTTETVKFDKEQDRQAVSNDLIQGTHNVRRVSIDGADRMIAYGRIGGEDGRPVFALIITPTETVHAPAEAMIAQIEGDLRSSLVNTGGILLLLLLAVGIIAFGLSFRLTRPIVEMASASRRVAGGDLDTRVDINRRDELGQLGKAFNEMVPALRDRMRIRESLAVAMQVQQSLLPNHAPTVAGMDIAGHSEYCDETGGDYYDFIQLDRIGPGSLAIAVGDVTGHGIAAALLMATGRALIRSHANNAGSLGEVFTAVNKQLCDSEFTGRFMTLMYLIVENKCDANGCMPIRYLSAGHDPVLVYRPDEDRFIELAGNDIPLGIDADWAFHEKKSDALRPGDVLVVGTDGIWECFNPDGKQFGKDRMRQVIQQSAGEDAKDIASAISQACRVWRGTRDQEDDITMVVVKLEG